MRFQAAAVVFLILFGSALRGHAASGSYLFEMQPLANKAQVVKFQDGYTAVLGPSDAILAEGIFRPSISRAAFFDEFNRMHPFYRRLVLSITMQMTEGLGAPLDASSGAAIPFLKEVFTSLTAAEKREMYQLVYVQSLFNFTGLKQQNIESILQLAAHSDRQAEVNLTCYAMSVVAFYTQRKSSGEDVSNYRDRVRNVLSNVRGLTTVRPHLLTGRCNQPFYDKGYFNFSIREVLAQASQIKSY